MSAPPTASTADVAGIIPERVRATSGDFTAQTNPTATQVTSLIAGVVNEVQAVVGVNVDALLTALATRCVAVGVAAQVELDFTNELAADRQGKWAQLRDEYENLLKRLSDAQTVLDNGGTLGSAGDPNAPPSLAFTVLDNEAVGFDMTRWQGQGF